MRTSLTFVALFALSSCTLSGCAMCGSCIDHEVILRVRAAGGGAVSDVTVSGFRNDPDCVVGTTETVCTGYVFEGDLTIVVEAPGFQAVTLERSFPNPNGPNCSCDFRDVDEVVELTAI